jgi:hypothetical protein
MTDWNTALIEARAAAAELHDRARTLGYRVGAHVGGDIDQEPEVSYSVRRFDLPSDTAETFAGTGPVSAYLDHVETMQSWCLELVDNPRVDVTTDEKGTATWIVDSESGEMFGVRTVDLENVTRLCVHAESAPTIGNWHPTDPDGSWPN